MVVLIVVVRVNLVNYTTMEKILYNVYGDAVCYNTDTNTISEVHNENIDVRSIIFAKQDGQAITSDEVVDYKAGDIVLLLKSYGREPNNKIVIINDVVGKYDIEQWYNEVTKKDNEIS